MNRLTLADTTRRAGLLALLVVSLPLALASTAGAHRPPADRGVTLYSEEDYRGDAVTFDDDVAFLGHSRIGNDRVRSVRVEPGCHAVLYRNSQFRGSSVRVDRSLPSLARTPVGLDEASSLEVRCPGDRGRGPSWSDDDHDRDDHYGDDHYGDDSRDDEDRDDREYRLERGEGVILFSDADFRGDAVLLDSDLHDLGRTRVGNDRVSSVRVAPGCRATLFTDDDFRGRSFSTSEDVYELHDTPVGNDRVSSVRVECRGGYGGGWDLDDDDDHHGDDGDDGEGWGGGSGEGVIVYTDVGFRGRAVRFARDYAVLDGTALGNDNASSVRVPEGCIVILYEDADFRGRSIQLRDDEENLAHTMLRNDSASSLKVRCR